MNYVDCVPDRLDQTGECGVFDFYEHVFTEDDKGRYTSDMGPAYHKTTKGKPRTAAQKRPNYKTY